MTSRLTSGKSVLVHGRGPGLLLAHGAGSDIEDSYGPILETLAGRRTVIGPDYPGSGDTPFRMAHCPLIDWPITLWKAPCNAAYILLQYPASRWVQPWPCGLPSDIRNGLPHSFCPPASPTRMPA